MKNTRFFPRFLLLLGIFCVGLNSCAPLIKGVLFGAPNVTDHQRHFPCDTIKANPNPKLPFYYLPQSEQKLPKLDLWIDKASQAGKKTFEEIATVANTNAFIVMRNDTVLYERYFNGRNENSQLVGFSVSKALTACLVAIAIREGKMSMEQSIADFIPEFRNDDRKLIKVKHLLNMTEGINWIDYKHLFWLGIMYYNSDIRRFVINRTALEFQPGTHFAYKSIATQMLGMALEGATGQRQADYLQQKLWNELEMPHNALYTMDSKRKKMNRPFGGLALTARSMLHAGYMLLHNGEWKGKQVVPADFVKMMSQRTIAADKWWGYTNCFWLNTYLDRNYLDMTDYNAAGYHGQYIYVSPEHNMVIIRLGFKDTRMDWTGAMGRLCALLGGIGNDLTDPKKYDLSAQFEGVYMTNRSEQLVVVDKGFDKYGVRKWTIYKDKNRTVHLEKWEDVTQNDGRSVVLRNFGRQKRLMFEDMDNKVMGVYYDDLLNIDTKYFEKISDTLPPKYAKKSYKQNPHPHK